ncbi:hypothetical protein Bbelb_178800 [Branchiostoma belcheri]|nr:hypothetical protein Bbelb_178800 [Branchiostoma belcheri]
MADPPVWDGKWHSICTTWRSSDGTWQFYADGVLTSSGSGFNVGGRVRKGGTWILGQDQDAVGGGFDADQAFTGELSGVNLWDRVLSPAEIAADCSYHGNVIDWDTTNIRVFGQASRAEYQCNAVATTTSPSTVGGELEHAIYSPKHKSRRSISGAEPCELSTFHHVPQSDCSGSDIARHPGVSLQFCADACCAVLTCLSFQYNVYSECFLKNKLCLDAEKGYAAAGNMYDRPAVSECPAGWSLFSGKCYKVFTDTVTYSQARQVCIDNGGSLAMVKNSEINSFLKTLSSDHKWFGLSDEVTEGQFLWEDGGSLTSTGFTDWYPGEPNGGSLENCVQYWRQTWNDRSCTDQLGFTCEVRATTPTPTPTPTPITVHESSVNIARGRPAWQSSTRYEEGTPDKAVNGDRSGYYSRDHSCSHTAADNNAWWYVDLGSSHSIERVVIFNREDCCSGRLNPFRVHVGNSTAVRLNPSCGGDYSAPNLTVACGGLTGRYVGVLLPGSSRVLTLCEVEVYGSKVLKWRDDSRCGDGYTVEDGSTAECNPDSDRPCCSPYNYCGYTTDHCDCEGCVDYRKPVKCDSWTKWLNVDNPGTTGDWESLHSIRRNLPGQVCDTPTAIDARVVGTGQDAWSTGENFAYFDATAGFVCRKVDQPDNTCLDYEVRFCCRDRNMEDWTKHGSGSYKFLQSTFVNYTEARALCSAEGAKLAMPKDQATHDFIVELRNHFHTNINLWIGLNDINVEGDFVWEDGTPLGNLTRWFPSQPNNGNRLQHCAVLTPETNPYPNQWRDDKCSDTWGVICEKGCPENYNQFKDSCFQVFEVPRTLYEARAACATQGGLLAMPKDNATNTFLMSLMQPNLTWFGLEYQEAEGQWRWEDAPLVPSPTTEPPEDTVYNVTTNSSTFRWELESIPAISFAVEANVRSDVRLALSPVNNSTGTMYEIIIGGWNNLLTTLRRTDSEDHIAVKLTPGILPEGQFRRFWVQFIKGTVRVGKDNQTTPLVEWTDPSPIDVRFVGFATSEGILGQFRFYSTLSGKLEVFVGAHTIFSVRFTAVVEIPWNEEYRNAASMAYQGLVNDTTQSVSQIFATDAAFHGVVIHDISPGSVVVIFSVQFIGARPNETAVHANMASAVADSLLVVAGYTVSELWPGGAEGGLCSGVACANHAVCVQRPEGELQCTCRNGYSGDGTVECQDIDECGDGSHTCSRDELCFNTEGSYRCAQCYPDFTVQGGADIPASAVTILRRVGFFLRTETNIDCNVEYTVFFAWTVWSVEGSDSQQLNTTGKLKTSAHEIAVPKNFLPLGLNMLKVVVTVLEKESGLRLNRSLERWVRIISSPIEARIAGGSARSVSFGSDITLDAAVSYDPDNIIKDSRLFNFSWTCMRGEATPCNEVFLNVSTEAAYVIPSGVFRPNDTITFTVDVSFAGRVSGIYAQAIHLGVEDPTISLRCNSNCNNRMNPSERLALQAVCENCLQGEQVVYNWTLQKAPSDYRRSIFNWETDTTTGNLLPDLVVQADIFTKPGAYVLRVDVVRAEGVSGFAEYRFEPNTPPTVGTCSASPETGVAMVDEFSVQCTGFADSDLPMTFAFFYSTGGQRLVAINSTAEDDELSLFYSGLVPSTPPIPFPVGLPSRDYNVTIVVRATDVLGAQATVGLVVKVFPLPVEETSSVATQLTIGANSTLGKLVQGGNFQAAVQISNSVNSVLNVEATNATDQDKQNATQVRSSIISSLSEFKVQSVSSVNILANALSQATVVQEEVSTDSQVTAAASLVDLVEIIQNQPEEELGIEEAEESSVFLTSALVNVMRASSYSSQEAKSRLTGRTKTDRLQQTQAATSKVFGALNTMNDVVLSRKRPNEKPTLLQQDNFELSLRKQTCDQMSSQIVTTTEENGGWFRTPDASILFGENTCRDPVDSETYQTTLNPYEYSGDSDRIQSSVGALKYKNDRGELTVSNLESPVEVVVERRGAVQVQTERGRTGRAGTGVMSIHSFNVTDEENSIHVIVTPDLNWVPIRLYLWRQDQPIKGQYGWNVTLPLSSDQLYSVRWLDGEDITADPYSWFWTPEEVATGEGQRYYLGVEHVPFNQSGFDLSDLRELENGTSEVEFSYSDENFTLPYTVTILSTRCLFFDDQSHRWKSDGCRSGPLTNANITHCFCDHLTAFGSDFQFFVAPNSLNILKALQGFNNISENPAVVIAISVIVGIYLLMVLWARWKDRKDVEKVGATVLGSSPGGGCSVYQVVVFTGARANAGTTAKVTVMFYGDTGESGPHELDDPRRMTFCTGGVDSFLVTSSGGMGPLNYIHIWHDNSGDDPSWFLSKIIVTDVNTDRKYYFLCDKWFAVEEGDGKVERIFPVASDQELKRFKTIFSSKTGAGFRDDHLWFSVLGRPAYSTFSRVQRVSCCLSLLLCTMLANIMFFGTGDSFQKPPAVNIFGFDVQLPISWGEIMIAIESALLVFPINLAIVQIFRHCGPRPAQLKETDQDHGKKAGRESSEHSEGKRSCINSSPATVITEFTDDDRELIREILSSCRTPSQLTNIKTSIAKRSYDVKRAESVKKKKTKKAFLLPWWCVYIGWFLVFSSCFVSAFFTILYGFEYGRQKAEAWLFTFLTSFFFDLVITQPIKILLLGIVFALIIKKIDTSGEEVAPTPIQEDEEYLVQDAKELGSATSMKPRATGPPDDQELLKARQQRFLELSLRSALLELSFFTIYVFILILVANGNRDFYMYHMTSNVENVFTGPFSKVTNREKFWTFMRSTLVSELHSSEWYNGKAIDSDKLGFLSDYNSYIVGPARLRQLRVKRSGTCQIPGAMTRVSPTCHGEYSWWNNDDGHYTLGWKEWTASSNDSVNVANVSSELRPWVYQSTGLTTATPHYGLHGMYYGGGYILELQSNDSNLNLQTVDDLERGQWIDSATRAIFVELIVYNPNANLFSVVSLLADFSSLGKVYTHHETTWSYAVLAFQIMFVLVTFVFAYREVNRILLMGTDYFRLFWNLVELCVCLLSLAQIGLQLYTTYIILDFTNKAGRTNDRSYSKYKQAASWDQLNTYVQAWLVCTATLKLMHLCRFNKHVERSAITLTRSTKPLLNYMVIFIITVSAFCMLTYLVLGASLEGYSPYITNVETMLGVMLGGFDFNALSDAHHFLGPVIFFGYLMFVNFLLLMMFCAILDVAYHEVIEGESEDEKSKNQKITELGMAIAGDAYQRTKDTIERSLGWQTHTKTIRGNTPAYTKAELMEDLLQARRKALSFIRSKDSHATETEGSYRNSAFDSHNGTSNSTKKTSDSFYLENDSIPGYGLRSDRI